MRVCPKYGVEKEDSEFFKSKKNLSGLSMLGGTCR
jgi:hypothetical protein